MIQRIQTVYLFLASIFLLLMFCFPLAEFYHELNGAYKLWIFGLQNMVPGGDIIISRIAFMPLVTVIILIAALLIFTIFKYNNRKLQMQITNSMVFLTILVVMAIFLLYIPFIEKGVNISPTYTNSFSIFLPLLSLVFMILAIRGIRKDEKKVRSVDRLR